MLFIRYNPHTFHRDGMRQLVSGTDAVQAVHAKQLREERLVETIKNACFGSAKSLRVLYMYYDCHRPLYPSREDIHKYHLNVWLNAGYSMRQMCVPVIT